MSKKTTLVIVLLLVVVAIGIAVVHYKSKKPSSPALVQINPPTTPPPPSTLTVSSVLSTLPPGLPVEKGAVEMQLYQSQQGTEYVTVYQYMSSQTLAALNKSYSSYLKANKWTVTTPPSPANSLALSAQKNGQSLLVTVSTDKATGHIIVGLNFSQSLVAKGFPADLPTEAGAVVHDASSTPTSTPGTVIFVRDYNSNLSLAQNYQTFYNYFTQAGWQMGPGSSTTGDIQTLTATNFNALFNLTFSTVTTTKTTLVNIKMTVRY